MSCNPNVREVISPRSPDVKGFSVNKAVRVTAFNLSGKDSLTFKRVDYCSPQANFGREGCCLFTPEQAQVASAVEYKLGECAPSLNAKRNTLIIPYAGSYLPVVKGNESADLRVEIEPIEGNVFSEMEKGIVPCGSCFDEVWTTTGTERCNQHFVEQEEISNCGNIRWMRTQNRCGYYASVPIPISLYGGGGCGSHFMGYLFHPDEVRDPDATVEIRDCSGKLYGYAYPNAGEGHTLPIEECGNDTPIGYAVNNSATAPQPIMGC